ncbi:hypothetical protein AYI70_g8597 [Smittium culicis]|uniref:Reverse transcriptase domain-containing protein n=1 Tax=Smittium culicis TaxID=133412 RepID=A0A1R1XF74_9FUNG|nr:hypothetical protein AYI70_g8597 [Smittium culicis]
MEQVTETQAPASQDQTKVLTEQVQQILREREFTIPKKTGGLRPVLDLRKLNHHVEQQNFKMETLASIYRMIRPKDYMTSLYLQDAFMHILIYKQCRKYLRFHWNDRCFQFRALPFGLSLSPLVFTKILRPESSINIGRSTSWKADATTTTRAQKPSSVNIEFMDIDSNFDETSNPEPVLLEESANVMERSLVIFRDAGNGDIYRFQGLSLGNSSGPPLLLWNMEPQGSKTSYQHKRTVDSAVCTEAQECSGKISVGLLRQHNHTRICQEIWGHNLTRITGINREDLVPLPQDQHSSTGNIRSIRIKPSGRAQQTDIANRPQMDQVQQSVLLPTLEHGITGNPEGPPRESHNDTSDSNMEIRNLVPRTDGAIDFTATASPSNNSGPRSEKRKVAALGKQELELDGLEDQRRFFETQGLGTYAIDFIVSSERRVRRRSRYSSIQQRFLDWRISNEISTPISAPRHQLPGGNIHDSSAELAAHPMFSEFIKESDDTSIKPFIRSTIDKSPVIELFREWVQNSSPTVKQITAKLCWLLSLTCFLRASDIHRIDYQRSQIEKGVLNLVIVAPKEKRGGRPVEKSCQINPHADIILCPVNAYIFIKEKEAFNPCPTPHINNRNWSVHSLIRYAKDTSKSLSVDIITIYFHSLSNLILRDLEAPIPKGRAICANLAASVRVSADNIVSLTFWSNYIIFDTYYRITKNFSNNLTESILNLK